jgi:hypothetical protein
VTPGMCVLCQPKERAAEIGHVCRVHWERLDDQLRQIETETVLLSAAPSLAQRTGTRGGALASERSPARLDVLTLTDPRTRPDWDNPALSVLGVLGGWARAVREDRQLRWPDRITVASERRTLATQLDYVCAQPWVDEFSADVSKLLRQLQAANRTGAERKKPVGVCPTLYDDGECGGSLWLDDARGVVICGDCGRTFAPDELRHLGRLLIAQGYVELFRAEWFTGIPVRTIRRWIAEGRITHERNGRKLLVQIRELVQMRQPAYAAAVGESS